MSQAHHKPFFARIWPASLANLVFAGLLAVISFSDVLIAPYGEWVVGQPAPRTYRAPATHPSIESEIERAYPAPRRIIVRRGQTINEADLEDLGRLVPERKQFDPRLGGGVLIFFFLALTFFNLVLRRYRRLLLLRLRSVVSMYLALALSLLAARLLLDYTSLSMFAAPIFICAILFTPLIGQNMAFILHLLAVALMAPMIGINRGMVLIPLVSGWIAILLLGRKSGPMRMLLAAFCGSAIGELFLAGLSLFTPLGLDLSIKIGGDVVGLAGGVMASGLAAGILSYPVAFMFGHISPSRLRKLLVLDHPLLKDLAEKAPGTFQHSLAVANMAEKIADDIGADSDLVRAGAYFHDIGKIQLPTYFIENQQGENPHDKIPPLESASKLRSHTEAGVTIARGANVPERIIDFIIEHHGRSTMEYFMDKAYKTDGKVPAVSDYSYNGRNPTSRETAILMIVDSMEAASRTLKEPAQAEIENLVRRILFFKLLHGYLDDSGLTTGDLKQIGISLVKFLQAQFHVRVVYPWQKQENQRPPLQVMTDTHAGAWADGSARVAQPVEQPAAPVAAAPATAAPDERSRSKSE